MTAQVAFLRSINVGGNRKVPMAQLREVFAEAGATDVRTYVQSGNVVFTPPKGRIAAVRDDLEARIEAATGFAVPVILRSRAEMAELVAHNPYEGTEPTKLIVVFLDTAPPKDVYDDVDAEPFAPETWTLRGRDLYLFLPDGQARTKLPGTLAKRWPTKARGGREGTARNWRTVEAVLEMASD